MTAQRVADRHPLIVKNIVWQSEGQTEAFARSLAGQPAINNALIELQGDLGAGKTTFVRHLLHSLGVQGRIKSPTYAVVEPYTLAAASGQPAHNGDLSGGLSIWHFDFYRFNDPREWEDAGFRDIFASPGLKLVEWPEKAGEHLPSPDLLIQIDLQANEARSVTLTAHTPIGAELIA
ncbi:tRNA (adenosine(37)-N6)-threonylcarbamoyltransferase complex ATPase subunit type 1 TsaE [Polaromonas sp. YR568]|uniref:tRNA (adenosine(37)-N6)-threonylcarbamoyltransferase complex ATPase subunit type 1 TsaE n=1 Tax=Polaromonas sp. YR568 TaxID=1855301 RepID=UPI00313847E2